MSLAENVMAEAVADGMANVTTFYLLNVVMTRNCSDLRRS